MAGNGPESEAADDPAGTPPNDPVGDPRGPQASASPGQALDVLFAAALAAREHAYAPYSGFKVGAAVLTSGGAVYAGCNVENASYPVGTCAEEGAIAAMVAAGSRSLVHVVIVAQSDPLVTPCGACRQRLREFGGPETRVHAADPFGIRKSYTLDELLPASFGPSHLGGRTGSRSLDAGDPP